MGVMVFITLILALELMNRTVQAPPVQTKQIAEQVQSTITELKAEVRKLESRIATSGGMVENLPSLDTATLAEMTSKLDEDASRIRTDIDKKQRMLADRKNQLASAQQKDASTSAKERSEIDELQKKIDALKEKLKDAEDKDRTYFTEGVVGKTTYLVEITSSGFSVAQIGVKSSPKTFANRGRFERWLTGLSPQKDALYLIVKPNAVANFTTAQKAVERVGVDYGYTLAGKSQKFIDAKTGAGKP